ncbi:hypothetical protein EV361DRAFT_944979 [Lentinula raphanica]|nr:hypothetical protein F5880DRAFT_1610010 [Lentinula raphanica]KAJ3976792.1 hypothetical protein EV361DRAFT_944979 [Lentinula raphanica]
MPHWLLLPVVGIPLESSPRKLASPAPLDTFPIPQLILAFTGPPRLTHFLTDVISVEDGRVQRLEGERYNGYLWIMQLRESDDEEERREATSRHLGLLKSKRLGDAGEVYVTGPYPVLTFKPKSKPTPRPQIRLTATLELDFSNQHVDRLPHARELEKWRDPRAPSSLSYPKSVHILFLPQCPATQRRRDRNFLLMAVDLVPHIHPRAASTSPGIFINEQTSEKIMNPGIHNIQLSKGPHAHPRLLIHNQSLTTLLAILEALSTLTPATTSMSSVVTVISLSSSPSPSSPSLPSQGLEILSWKILVAGGRKAGWMQSKGSFLDPEHPRKTTDRSAEEDRRQD